MSTNNLKIVIKTHNIKETKRQAIRKSLGLDNTTINLK